MPLVTPSFVFDLESRMRRIQVNLFAALAASENQWWDACTKRASIGSRREVITWILETAQIKPMGRKGGNIGFDDMVSLEFDYEVQEAGRALKIPRKQFEDLDGNGINMAMSWVRQHTALAAYWPQKSVVSLIAAGETGLCYDGLPFFSKSHPQNPYDTPAGVYPNLITSVPIDVSVTAEVALGNLATVFSTIRSIKMPNGVDPRFLKPAGIIAPPVLFPRVVQLTSAKFLAMAAGSAGAQGGSADVEGLISALGYGKPIQAPEFAGDDTTYYVVAEEQAKDELGGLIYSEREPYSIRYYTGRGGGTGVDAILDRADELEWHHTGRNTALYGHPYLLFKCKASA